MSHPADEPPPSLVHDPRDRSESTTIPLPLTKGDRLKVDARLDLIDERVAIEGRIAAAFRDEIRGRVLFMSAIMWFALGMATASLVVQLVRIVLVAAGRPPS